MALRAQRLLEDMRAAEARVAAGSFAAGSDAEAALALDSAAGYRRRRRVLLEEIA